LILGIGIDLLETARMRRALERSGERFVTRVFTPEEAAYCRLQRRPEQRFAARFAAKEALLKALGTGWSQGIGWKEVEVVRASGHPPEICLAGRAAAIASRRGVTRIHLSLTHLEAMAAAMVVLEGDGSP
jgi:holo-[acyl-carrier protein] synthase